MVVWDLYPQEEENPSMAWSEFLLPFPNPSFDKRNFVLKRIAIHERIWKIFAFFGIIFTVILSVIYLATSDYTLLTPG